jgi:hypothetical protein
MLELRGAGGGADRTSGEESHLSQPDKCQKVLWETPKIVRWRPNFRALKKRE